MFVDELNGCAKFEDGIAEELEALVISVAGAGCCDGGLNQSSIGDVQGLQNGAREAVNKELCLNVLGYGGDEHAEADKLEGDVVFSAFGCGEDVGEWLGGLLGGGGTKILV